MHYLLPLKKKLQVTIKHGLCQVPTVVYIFNRLASIVHIAKHEDFYVFTIDVAAFFIATPPTNVRVLADLSSTCLAIVV